MTGFLNIPGSPDMVCYPSSRQWKYLKYWNCQGKVDTKLKEFYGFAASY